MEDYLLFFGGMPGVIHLYEAIRGFICSELENVTIKAQKTQISFSNRNGFAYVSLPHRKIKGYPEHCVILTFGLGCKLKHPRIWVSEVTIRERL